MTTATIDLDALNNLFDNQKKLDDIFSSIFDDDALLITATPVNNQSTGSSDQEITQDFDSYDDFSFYAEDPAFSHQKRSIINFVAPVVIEIAIIFYAIMYFV